MSGSQKGDEDDDDDSEEEEEEEKKEVNGKECMFQLFKTPLYCIRFLHSDPPLCIADGLLFICKI